MTQDDSQVSQPWWNGLRLRIVFLLTISILPIGLIAIFQTNLVARTAKENLENAQLLVADRAAQEDRLAIQRAFGAASMLGEVYGRQGLDPASCNVILQEFVTHEPAFSFAGIVARDGTMRCASSDLPNGFADPTDVELAMADPLPSITVGEAGLVAEESTLLVWQPYFLSDVFAGYAVLAIPHFNLAERLDLTVDTMAAMRELITFNRAGEILTEFGNAELVDDLLPRDLDLAALGQNEARAFAGRAVNGEDFTYTVVPVENSPITVLGIWGVAGASQTALNNGLPTWLFPALMWGASLLVLLSTLYSLVLRHIGRLRRDMDGFALNRDVPDGAASRETPNEFRVLRYRFAEMTAEILHEEARLESLVREKNVLLKEIHHRVKNNLQMISSIMNMQIRTAEHDETVDNLTKIQNRVANMASIHTDLYTSPDEGRVNVGDLINTTVRKSVALSDIKRSKIKLDADIAPILLFPDQAVPLSLLAAEAATNAVKYLGRGPDGTARISYGLAREDQTCRFWITNTIGDRFDPAPESTGIGSKLIRVFSIKLGAEIETDQTDDTYTVQLAFPIAEFEAEARDF